VDLKIQGKAAVVTGGSKGIGRAVCEALVGNGCRVAVVARSRADIDATVESLRQAGDTAYGFTADINVMSEITRAVESARKQLGPIDIAVWNGYTPKHGGFDDLAEADFDEAYRAIVSGFAAFVRAVTPEMKERRWGRIITIGSRSVKQPVSPDAYVAERLKQIPLWRLGRPEEMAALVAFLASENGGYVTGETICCDGGRNESML